MKFLLAPKSIYLGLAFIAFFNINSIAQIGIGTVTPQGSLDIESTTQGVVLPRVVLTRTDTQAPVTNPQTGTILDGTVVYNTNTTIDGNFSVYPGIYVWIVNKWVPQFSQKQSVLIRQVGTDFRTTSFGGFLNIPLTASTFTPEFSGTYKIELSVNYGGGVMRRPDNNGLNTGYQTGRFRLRYNNGGANVDYFIPIKSYSSRYRSGSSYFAIWKQQSIVFYVIINRGDTPNFELTIDQLSSPEFKNNGNHPQGQGNVGDDIPCTIEIDFKGA